MTTLIKKILLLPATCLIPFLTGCNNCPSTTIVEDIIDPAIYTSLPFKMDKVEQPTFPDYSVNIIDFGAKPDGITLNTKAINDGLGTFVDVPANGTTPFLCHNLLLFNVCDCILFVVQR